MTKKASNPPPPQNGHRGIAQDGVSRGASVNQPSTSQRPAPPPPPPKRS